MLADPLLRVPAARTWAVVLDVSSEWRIPATGRPKLSTRQTRRRALEEERQLIEWTSIKVNLHWGDSPSRPRSRFSGP